MGAKYKNGLNVDWNTRVCPICAEPMGYVLCNDRCQHSACEWCWQQWIDTQLSECRALRQFNVRCFGEACARKAKDDIVMHVSVEAQTLKRDLCRRAKLQHNRLYPAALQANCSRPGCVGLGYLGFDTVMCFLCEYQWLADTGVAPGEELPGELKAARAAMRKS